MAKDNRFSVLRQIPPDVLSQMHPETKEIIQRVKTTKAKVLTFKSKNPRDAKNRMDALRRARKRGHVRYKDAHRKAGTLYFRLR